MTVHHAAYLELALRHKLPLAALDRALHVTAIAAGASIVIELRSAEPR